MRDGCFYHDAPVKNCDEDLLGRAPAAGRLAAMIAEDPGSECCAIGITGARGSGKSSIINMVCDKLREYENIFVLEFDPALYRASGDMTVSFFRTVTSELRALSRESPDLGKHKPGYTRIAGNTLKIVDRTIKMKVVGELSELSGSIVSSEEEPVNEIRRKISEQLRKSGCKLVIAIDSLDMLTAVEISQVLRLIRSTAGFDNTFYILGYCEGFFSRTATSTYYAWDLGKSMQAEIRIPEPGEALAGKVLREELPGILDKFGVAQSGRVSEACDSVSPVNLREVYRLLNNLAVRLSLYPDAERCRECLAMSYLETAYPEFCRRKPDAGTAREIENRFGKPACERAMKALRFLYPETE